jgi:hypothetical protein
MRRAALAVPPVPGACTGQRLSAVRWTRPRLRLLAVPGAGVVAVAVAVSVMVAAGSVAGEHVSRSAASSRVPVAAWGPVSGALGRDDPSYRAAGAGAGFVARNPRQRLRAEFSRAGVSVRSGQALLGLRLRGYGYGYGGSLRGVAAVAPTASGNRVRYRHGPLSEWYANGPLGLEQGFTLTARPAGRRVGPLTLALALSGNARGVLSRDLRAVTFSHRGSSLSYRGLVATDARGRTLPAWLQLRRRELLLRVNDAGARYPLRIDPFFQQAKLTASDGAAGDGLGESVAVQGDTIVAGAPQATINGNSGQGAAYVFVKPKGGWTNATETAKLTASDGLAGDSLGGPGLGSNAVGISGDTIVAGAPGFGAGAVYVFVKPKGGWRSETQTAKLTASDGGGGLGISVAIDGGTVVGGAWAANGNQVSAGAAYVFTEPKGGWRSETETAKLTASDGATEDELGWSAAIDGNTVVVGAPVATLANHLPGPGAAYVFVEPKGGWRSETEAAKLTASDGAPGDTLGISVAVAGDMVVAGADDSIAFSAPGAAYVFVKPKGGWSSETQTAKLTASDGAAGDALGTGVAIRGDSIVTGAPAATVNGNQFQGGVYVFVKPKGGWANETQTAKLTASDGAANDSLGFMVAVSRDTVAAGAAGVTVNGDVGQGAVYVFKGHGRDPQHVAGNASTRGTHPSAALRRAASCQRYAARHRAPAFSLLALRSRNRALCSVIANRPR